MLGAVRDLEAVVLDLDGVVIDSHEAIVSSINGALADHGLTARSPEELRRFIGPPTFIAFAELTGEDPASALVASCVAAYHRRYEEVFLGQTALIEHVEPALRMLAAALPLAIATSKPDVFVEPVLERLGVRRRFAAVAATPLSVNEEDKATTIRRALSELGRAPTPQVAMVGDRHFDVTAALELGLWAVGVTWGVGSEGELRDAGAEVIVHTPRELVSLLLGRDGDGYR
jgi:phosphoglycolate phosphatase